MTEPLDHRNPPVPRPLDIGRLLSHRSLPRGSTCRWCWQPLTTFYSDADRLGGMSTFGFLLICDHCDRNQGPA